MANKGYAYIKNGYNMKRVFDFTRDGVRKTQGFSPLKVSKISCLTANDVKRIVKKLITNRVEGSLWYCEGYYTGETTAKTATTTTKKKSTKKS